MENGRKGNAADARRGEGLRNPRARQRALCVAVGPQQEPDLAELRELLRTAGVAVAGELTQRRQAPDPDRYFGRGKLEEVRAELERTGANLIACDDELSPRQERNLEKETGAPVIDRTAVILDIFAGHAHTAEGKLQVELAQLQYNLARMRGLWTHLERLGAGVGVGGIGTRGPGESQIETDRRLARDRITALRRRLERARDGRRVMRAERERAHLPEVALAGYTNSGKSSLLGALTGGEARVADRLFHTLDPTTRAFEIAGRRFLLTDTVGFICKLPHDLVEAFGATLEEAVTADLVVHVADASLPEEELAQTATAVDAVLEEIGAGEVPRVLALNKVDLLDDERRRELRFRHPRAVQVSALTGEGLDDLQQAIGARFARTLESLDLLLPYDEGARLAELHDLAGDLEREDTAAGVRVRARVPAAQAHRFERFAANGERAFPQRSTANPGPG